MRDKLLSENIKFQLPFLLLYSSIALIVIGSRILGMDEVHNVFNPLLMIVLMVFISVNTKLSTPHSKLIFIALFFSMLGNIFLMPFIDDFILGLSSFLIVHVFYILTFIGNSRYIKGVLLNKTLSIPITLIMIGITYVIVNSMMSRNEFTVIIISVIIYSVIILIMELAAISNYNLNKSYSSKIILIGSLLFMVSDSILAINKFAVNIYLSDLYMLSLYAIAQWLIVKGSIIRYKSDIKEHSQFLQ